MVEIWSSRKFLRPFRGLAAEEKLFIRQFRVTSLQWTTPQTTSKTCESAKSPPWIPSKKVWNPWIPVVLCGPNRHFQCLGLPWHTFTDIMRSFPPGSQRWCGNCIVTVCPAVRELSRNTSGLSFCFKKVCEQFLADWLLQILLAVNQPIRIPLCE